MKKIFLFLSVFLFLFASCENQPTQDVKQVIDLRIKDSNGNVVRSVTENSVQAEELEYSININQNQNFGDFTEEMIENLVKFYDDENGFKIALTVPESFSGSLENVNVIYIDDNKNWSTVQALNWDTIHYWDVNLGDITSYDNIEWVYPLTTPNKKFYFAIQFFFKSCNFQVEYSLTPKHGIGMVDDLPVGWKSSDFISINENVLTLNDVIPVEVVKTVINENGEEEEVITVHKMVTVFATDTKGYWQGQVAIGGYTEVITDLSKSLELEIPVDDAISEQYKGNAYKYIYIQFYYNFILEGFESTTFRTNEFLTEITENTVFK